MEIKVFDYKKHIDSKIILYGTAGMKYIITWCLNKVGLNVLYYANRDGRYDSPYSNISLQDMLSFIREDKDIIILLASHESIRSEIKLLQNSGVECIYSVRKLLEESGFECSDEPEWYKNIFENRKYFSFFEDSMIHTDGLYIKSIDAVVTERCSLKCEGCSNLMQYYKKPVNLDVDSLCVSIGKIVDKAERLMALRILGGEPFMNLDFIKIIDTFGDCEKIINIEIYSNATIFPSEKVLDKLKNPRIIMILSEYGSLSKKKNEWIEWCKNNNVRYIVSKMDVWQDCGKLERHDYTEQELMDIYGNCVCRNVPTIIGDRLYNCAYGANASNLGAMYAEEMKRDYLEISDNLSKECIDHFLYDRKYLEACRYCNGRNGKRAKIVPHIQTKEPLEYERLIDVEMNVDVVCAEVKQCKDKISVIIPTYNTEVYIERCLKSIVNQTYKNLEILIVDDGSTDSTVSVCKNYQDDERVRIIECEHIGVSHARKVGILEASGDKIAFVDSDDYIDLDYLERMISRMDGCDLISSGYWEEDNCKSVSDVSMDRGQSIGTIKKPDMQEAIYEDNGLKFLWKYMFANFIYKIRKQVWGRIFRSDYLKDICELLDDRIWMGEDRLLFQLYMLKCHKVSYVNEYGYHYCTRPVKSRYPWENAIENSRIIKDIMMGVVKEHPCKEMLSEGIISDYVAFNRLALRVIERTNKYYYPYYGRLDGKRVVLYGAGNVGRSYYRSILEDENVILVAWIDKNAERLKDMEMLPVEPIATLDKLEFDVLIVALAGEPQYKAIRTELMDKGISAECIVWNKTQVLGE